MVTFAFLRDILSLAVTWSGSSLISNRVKLMALKLLFTASLFDTQHFTNWTWSSINLSLEVSVTVLNAKKDQRFSLVSIQRKLETHTSWHEKVFPAIFIASWFFSCTCVRWLKTMLPVMTHWFVKTLQEKILPRFDKCVWFWSARRSNPKPSAPIVMSLTTTPTGLTKPNESFKTWICLHFTYR